MSWLFAALIPGLLMLATFGLERLEHGLGVTGRPDAIDELVAHTPPNIERPAPPPEPAWSWTPRGAVSQLHGHAAFTGLADVDDEPGLPTRLCHRESGNPQFQPTRHANRV